MLYGLLNSTISDDLESLSKVNCYLLSERAWPCTLAVDRQVIFLYSSTGGPNHMESTRFCRTKEFLTILDL